MQALKGIMADFISLIYPRICVACGSNLFGQEQVLCTACSYQLPRVDNADFHNNKTGELFWGRIPVNYALSFFYYAKGSLYQNILHHLKYKKKQYIGLEMGRLFASEVKNKSLKGIDFIHAVPLHYKKLKKRGYNQSDLIAKGFSEVLNIPLISGEISRTEATETQTSKGRYERWENVSGIFKIRRPDIFKNKHVLLIDDVITTGATLEACANAILEIPGGQVSVASLALTRLG